jgi:hypothetical protein
MESAYERSTKAPGARPSADGAVGRLSHIDYSRLCLDVENRAERLRQVRESIEDGGGPRRRRKARKPPRVGRQIGSQVDRPQTDATQLKRR